MLQMMSRKTSDPLGHLEQASKIYEQILNQKAELGVTYTALVMWAKCAYRKWKHTYSEGPSYHLCVEKSNQALALKPDAHEVHLVLAKLYALEARRANTTSPERLEAIKRAEEHFQTAIQILDNSRITTDEKKGRYLYYYGCFLMVRYSCDVSLIE
jgi:tetratricopeptide (TPR) repeat protein